MKKTNTTGRRTGKKFYLTTAIAYVNAPPHIGFALESIQADAIARRKRQEGYEVRFLTGTDEHGDKIARTAAAAGLAPRRFVDRMVRENFKTLKRTLNLSWDDFIRTSDRKRHWPGALELWRRLEKSGDLYTKRYRGLYCVGCEKFITEKDLEGDLCPYHKKEPEIFEEENYFFRLSRYGERLAVLIESGRYRVLPEVRRNEVLAFIRSGLEDVSFSRSREKISWGIPVPKSDQTIYVWCDALTNYLSAAGFGGKSREEKARYAAWWPADLHLVGKDIVRFHAVIWPAMLMAAKIPLPKRLYAHGFVTVNGEKISKSLGNAIDPVGLVRDYGADALRYYLLREVPSDEDGDFSEKKLESRYASDLAKGLGNFASRVTALAAGLRLDPARKPAREVARAAREADKAVARAFDAFRLHEAAAAAWGLVSFGDGYVNAHRPWETKSEKVIADLVWLLEQIGRLVEPFVPEAGGKIRRAVTRSARGLRVRRISALFPRREEEVAKSGDGA